MLTATGPDSVAATCPECGALTANLGLDFASPPKKDHTTWEHLKTLYQVGITFHSCGCSGPGYIPRTTEALVQHLEERMREYHQNLRYWLTKAETGSKKKAKPSVEEAIYQRRLPKGVTEKPAALAYWTEKIQFLTDQLAQLRSRRLPLH